MPAAAVIPAPIAYIQVVAVKKLVVEFWIGCSGLVARLTLLACDLFFWESGVFFIERVTDPGLLL